jgi:OH-DDVA meta-cleavage compound hydrolase
MIIDCHGHYTSEPPAFIEFRKQQIAAFSDASKTATLPNISDDQIRERLEPAQLKFQRERGTDVTIFSPRASAMGHHVGDARLSAAWTRICNDMIHRIVNLYPTNFIGVCQLPQSPGVPPENCIPELERCVKELGFVGCLLNPDPYENSGQEAPPLGDRYWYPLYEKLTELDIPAHIHTASSRSERASYSVHLINEGTIAILGLLSSDVFKDFPNLKIIVSHGGGAIPYQLGRFDAPSLRGRGATRFRDRLKLLYFDTVLYTAPALELLIKTVGPDRCLFGSECPGVGSTIDPDTGYTMDHIRPHIEGFAWLSPQDRNKIFADNARKVFKLKI